MNRLLKFLSGPGDRWVRVTRKKRIVTLMTWEKCGDTINATHHFGRTLEDAIASFEEGKPK